MESTPVVDLTLEEPEAPRPRSAQAASWHEDLNFDNLSESSLRRLQTALQHGKTTTGPSAAEATVLKKIGWRDDGAGAWSMPDGDDGDDSAKARLQQVLGQVFYALISVQQEAAERATQKKVQLAEAALVDDDDDGEARGSSSAKRARHEPQRARHEPQRARAAAASSSAPTAIDLISDDDDDEAPAARATTIELSDDDEPSAAKTLRVRLALPAAANGGRRLNLSLPGSLELIYVLCVPRVQHALAQLLGSGEAGLSALELAERFEIAGPPGVGGGGGAGSAAAAMARRVYDRAAMQRVTLREALGGDPGVLCVHEARHHGTQRAAPEGAAFVPSPLKVIGGGAAACDRVVVVRLRATHDPRVAGRSGHLRGQDGTRANLGTGSFGSPVLLVKNYRRDRGFGLMREFGVTVNPPMSFMQGAFMQPLQAVAPGSATVAKPQALHKHAEAVLELCSSLDVVRKDEQALAALQGRQQRTLNELAFGSGAGMRAALHAHREVRGFGYGWMPPVGLAYPRGATLHRHVDGMGEWVVLFSFGLTCEFYAGNRTLTIESGDALVFNGGMAHAVTHGLDRVHSQPSLDGVPKALPDGMLEKLQHTRVSVQVRQM